MQFRTDMADERRDLYKKANQIEDEIDGIECEIEKSERNKNYKSKDFKRKWRTSSW